MSSSLCGPSNALSSLQKHTAVDRSLHRQHLPIQSGHSEQDFRRGRAFPAKSIDHEFENFSAPHIIGPPAVERPAFEAPFIARTWVGDFEQHKLSSPSTFSSPQIFDTSGWHAEFTASQKFHSSAQAAQPTFPHNQLVRNEHIPYNTFHSLPSTDNPLYSEDIQFDEHAFENAFEQAASELEQLKLATDIPENEIIFEKKEQEISEVQKPQENAKQEDLSQADELAQTAGKLLDSVRENSSDKFQNSKFLGLMRKLRDREVLIHGDNIVEK